MELISTEATDSHSIMESLRVPLPFLLLVTLMLLGVILALLFQLKRRKYGKGEMLLLVLFSILLFNHCFHVFKIYAVVDFHF